MRGPWNSIFIAILLVSLLVGSSTLTRGHEWGDDFASYIMQAQSILAGDMAAFVEHNSFTIFQSSFQIGPVAYPWGYPLILTPALLLKGLHPLTLKLPGLFFFAGFLTCLYCWTKNRLTPPESLLLVSLFAFNPVLIKFLDQILSDIPLLFFTSLGLILVLNDKHTDSWWKHLVLGAVLFFAFFMRTTGILLLASFLVYEFIDFFRHQETRRSIFRNSAVTTLAFVSLWLITTQIFPNGQGSYLQQLKDLTPNIFKENLINYFYLFASFFGTEPVWTYVYYVLLVFFLLGAWARSGPDLPLLIFFVLYFIAMLFWPDWQGMRFIFPLLPIFVYFVFQGMKLIIHRLPGISQQLGQSMFYGFWLLLIGIFLFNSGTRAYENAQGGRNINGPFDPVSSDMYNYILSHTPSESVIVFWKPRALRLFTQRDTFMSTECKRLPLADYVVLSKKAENSQVPTDQIDQCNLGLHTVFENQRFIIYAVPQ